jgi:hypothetical protein
LGKATPHRNKIPCRFHAVFFDADFKSEKEMTEWLTLDDPKTTPALKVLRSLAASAIRVAVTLPAQAYTGGAKVAKERGSIQP